MGSRKSSPTKQLQRMQIRRDRLFSLGKLQAPAHELPPGLVVMVDDMKRLSQAIAVVPAGFRDELCADRDTYGRFFPHNFAADHDPSCSAAVLPPAKVKRIRDRATLWEKRFEDEASWNMEVHHHILRAVCRPKGRRAAVDFISCTTARISPTFIPSGERGKMVDSCLFIDPAAYGATAEERIQDLCSRQPHGSINHTDHMPLFGQPIAVSVETKRSAVDWDNATLQTGTWQAAQLRCLSQLATLAATSYGRESLGSPTAGVAVIDFVPGIIIQGHDWHLVASVHTGGVTTFRTKIPIGTTETVLGVYKILAALTYLVRWSENVYWPCFKQTIQLG
ncbi:hypothetical protein JX266_014181 [Neoarthrinium moseri]|nr:hypothetical protein JX266_014181 [Neoarthrinium moseri]